jgi:hypothetical protein
MRQQAAYLHGAHCTVVLFGPMLIIHLSNSTIEAGISLIFLDIVVVGFLCSFAASWCRSSGSRPAPRRGTRWACR